MSMVSPYGGGQTGQPLITKNGFEILVDVRFFQPEQISVKVINNFISINAETTERQPGYPIKYIRRKVDQHFAIPPGYDSTKIVSGISPEGILSVRCGPPAQSYY